MLETDGVAVILEVSAVTVKDEVVNKEVDCIGEKEDRMEGEGITTGVVAITELSRNEFEEMNEEIDGVGVEKEDKIVDETVTAGVAAMRELSDVAISDGVGEMNEEVDGIGVEKED